MGASQSEQANHIVIIDTESCLIDQQDMIKQKVATFGLTCQFFSNIDLFFEIFSQDTLRNIITIPQCKDQTLKFLIKHHFTNTKFYIWALPDSNVGQEDYDNVYITLIDSSLENILKHIKNNVNKDVYMPLLKMNRALQKKVNVKLISDNEQKNGKWRYIFEENHLSYQIFKDSEEFDLSTSISVSDFLICQKDDLKKVLDIVNLKFRKINLIYYQEHGQDEPLPQAQKYIVLKHHQMREIVLKITKLEKKMGWRTQKIDLISLPKPEKISRKKEEEREQLISSLKQKHPDIDFQQIQDVNDLLKKIKKNKYSTVLFLESKTSDYNNFKRLLLTNHLQYRVLLFSLKNISYAKKAVQFQKLELVYYTQHSKPRSIDWINKHIKSHHLDSHKKMLFMNSVDIRQYTSVTDYKEDLNKQFDMSPIVMCTAHEVEQIELIFNEKKIKNIHIFCFDKKEHIALVRKKKIFDNSPYYSYSSSNIKDIAEQIKKITLENLITDYVSVVQQMDAFYEAKDKFQVLKKSSVVKLKISPFPDTEVSRAKTKEQVSFTKHSSQKIQNHIDIFLEKFIKLWRIDYNPIKDLMMLKKDLKKIFLFVYRCEILRIQDHDFQKHYLAPIESCQTICQLALACITIYSLPHGFSQIIYHLLSQFENNIKLLRLFCPYVFCLVLNFCNFFEERLMQKTELKIYIEDSGLEVFNPGDILHNISFFNCVDMDFNDSKKDYILVEYEYTPLSDYSFYSSLLFIEPYSFYKEDVEYIFAPYEKFQVVSIEKVNGVKVMKLKNFNKTNLTKLFLEEILGSQTMEFFDKIVKDERYSKTLVSADKLTDKIGQLNYQHHLAMSKKKMMLTAEHKLFSSQFFSNKIITKKVMSKISKAWLYVRSGEYSKAQRVLKAIDEWTDSQVKEIISTVQKGITQIIGKRKEIYDSLRVQPAKQSTIKWTSIYVPEEEQFLLKQQNKQAGLMYQISNIGLSYKPIELKIDQIYIEYNLKENRDKADIWAGNKIEKKTTDITSRDKPKDQMKQLRKVNTIDEPLRRKLSEKKRIKEETQEDKPISKDDFQAQILDSAEVIDGLNDFTGKQQRKPLSGSKQGNALQTL